MNRAVFAAIAAIVLPSLASPVLAQHPFADFSERVHGAERVVVGTATDVRARWQENQHGDRLIVSEVRIRVDETLKGNPASEVTFDVEGGTLDGVTLRVSDLPQITPGYHAVFFLNGADGATGSLHHRGFGIASVEADGRLAGSSMRLSDLRTLARGR